MSSYILSMNIQHHRLRHWFRKIGIGCSGLIAAAALALGGGYIWFYGWTWKESPAFHESRFVELTKAGGMARLGASQSNPHFR